MVDTSDADDFGGSGDGYDIDGVRALHCGQYEVVDTTETDSDGHYCFFPEAGDYRVEEVQQEGWSYVDYFYQDIYYNGSEQVSVDFMNESDEPGEYGTLTICKQEDLDGDGDFDEGEPVVTDPFWTFYIGDDEYQAGENGCITLEDMPYGEYNVTEEQLAGWQQTGASGNGTLGEDGSITVNVYEGNPVPIIYFLNERVEDQISGCKYKDLNNNGVIDKGEPTVPGWEISLYECQMVTPDQEYGITCGAEVPIVATTTGSDGCYSFPHSVLENGYGESPYRLVEEGRDHWYPTMPETGYYEFTLPELDTNLAFDFANYHAYCGNNRVDAGEECDEGPEGSEGCSADCEIIEDDDDNGGGSNGGGGTPYCSVPGVNCSQTTTTQIPDEPVVKGEAGEPMLDLGKTINRHTVNPADNIEARLVVANNGNIDAVDVQVNDVWPEGFSSEGERTRTWSLGDMAPGQIEVLTYTVNVGEGAEEGDYDSHATALATNNPPVEASVNVDVEKVEVLAASGFSLSEFFLLVSALAALAGSAVMVRRRLV